MQLGLGRPLRPSSASCSHAASSASYHGPVGGACKPLNGQLSHLCHAGKGSGAGPSAGSPGHFGRGPGSDKVLKGEGREGQAAANAKPQARPKGMQELSRLSGYMDLRPLQQLDFLDAAYAVLEDGSDVDVSKVINTLLANDGQSFGLPHLLAVLRRDPQVHLID